MTPGRSRDGESGMVIVETAIAIPVLVTLAVTLLWAVGVVMSGLTLGDACSRVAREVSRGADAAATVTSMQAGIPDAQVELVDLDGGDLRVTCRRRASAPGLLRGLGFIMTRQVVAAREGLGS